MTPDMIRGRRPHVRMLATAALLGASSMILSGCSQYQSTAHLDGYQAGPGPRQITVFYLVDPADPDGKAEIIKQTTSDVTIRVRYVHDDDTNTAMAIAKKVVVDLAAPLDGRTVRDQSGTPIPAKAAVG